MRSLSFLKIIAIAAFLMLYQFVIGQPSSLWGNLKPGKYATGFKILWKYDYSRTWQFEKSYTGNISSRTSARPVRISIWYPAIKPSNGSMKFDKYVHLSVPSENFMKYNSIVETRDIGGEGKSLRGLFKSKIYYDGLLNTATGASYNAAQASGSFPVIIYSLGQNDYTQENVVLFEFLASHGYIVATVPHIGTNPRKNLLWVDDPMSYETQLRDLEFTIQVLSEFPDADKNRIVAMGMSMGGMYAMLLAMRNNNIDALVTLDAPLTTRQPPYYFKYWEKAPYFDTTAIRIPFLQLCRSSADDDIAATLRYSDRYVIELPKLIHADFTSYPFLTSGAPTTELDSFAITARDQKTAITGAELISNYILNFLDFNIKKNEQARARFEEALQNISSDFAIKKVFDGIKVPSEEEFYSIISAKGLDYAITLYRSLKEKYPDKVLIRLRVLNRIAFEVSLDNKVDKAVEIYKLVTVAYPTAEAFKNLADAYLDDNQKELAILNYKESLKINPENEDIKKKLKELEDK